MLRVLFASNHCYTDPSSGAALAGRDVLEGLARRGFDCRVLSTGSLDFAHETRLDALLESMATPFRREQAGLNQGGEVEVFDLALEGVRVTLLPTEFSRPERAPNDWEGSLFLDLGEQALDRFEPQVLLTYGGHPATLELIRRARMRRIAVVFHLHNFSYTDRRGFENVSAVVVPSEYARGWYRDRLGLDCVAIPYPIQASRVVVPEAERSPRYLTFVNPERTKGATVFARIAYELGTRRPEIPLLVVEGRNQAEGLGSMGLDLSGLSNLQRMGNTPDPRHFYGVTRVLVVPSLWRESFGRVAAEAMMNAIPVLASDRGALPETLGESGFVFTIADKHTPMSGSIPTAREVEPWLATIERLWDDAEWEAKHRVLALEESKRWEEGRIVEQFADLFERVKESG